MIAEPVIAEPVIAELATADRSRHTIRGEFRSGAADAVPLVVGYAPFALVLGATIADHAVPAAGWAGIWLVISGSALLSTVRALDSGAAIIAVVTGLLVNARLVMYSASMRVPWASQPRWFRIVGAMLLIDPMWALAERRQRRPGTDAARRAHYLGASAALMAGWSTVITCGMIFGSGAGPLFESGVVELELAVPLCLVALLADRLRDRSTRLTVVAAALCAVTTAHWPAGTGMLLVIGLGVVIGASRRSTRAGSGVRS